MRIPDSRCAEGKRFVPRLNLLVDHFATASGYGNFIAPETHPAHLHADGLAAVQHRASHHSTQGFNAKLVAPHQLSVPQVTRKDSQAIAAFLGLAAVGVEDAKGK